MVNRIFGRPQEETPESPPQRDGSNEARRFVVTVVGMVSLVGVVAFTWWLLWYLAAHAVGTAL